MKVTRFEADPDLRFNTTGQDRAPGLHLSDIIKTMQLEREKKWDPNKPLDMMLLEQGHTWEEVLAHALQRRWLDANPGYAGHRPEPIQLDGIWMSPDWFDPSSIHALAKGRVPVAEEWKATKVSSKKHIEDHHWYWFVQLLGYLKGLSIQYKQAIRHGRFRVWYINGDYSWDAKGSDLELLRGYVRYDVEFTEREINENWRKLLSQAIKHGLLEQEPEQVQEDEWESPRKTPGTAAIPRKPSSARPATSAPPRRATTSPTSRTSLKRRSA